LFAKGRVANLATYPGQTRTNGDEGSRGARRERRGEREALMLRRCAAGFL